MAYDGHEWFLSPVMGTSCMSRLYWPIGGTILKQQKADRWAGGIVDRLANEVQAECADQKAHTCMPQLRSHLAGSGICCSTRSGTAPTNESVPAP